MENNKIYVIISIISVLLLIPSGIWNYKILDIFSSIGCSALAASIMAIYIERNENKKRESSLKKSETPLFFRPEYSTKYAV